METGRTVDPARQARGDKRTVIMREVVNASCIFSPPVVSGEPSRKTCRRARRCTIISALRIGVQCRKRGTSRSQCNCATLKICSLLPQLEVRRVLDRDGGKLPIVFFCPTLFQSCSYGRSPVCSRINRHTDIKLNRTGVFAGASACPNTCWLGNFVQPGHNDKARD